MRLWHYELIHYLPKSQLLAQWRELNSIFKKQNKHILVNYVYEYPKNDLYTYTIMVTVEIQLRGYKIKKLNNFFNYFGVDKTTYLAPVQKPFEYHHDQRYLIQCFYNLQEKFDRGQSDFKLDDYNKLVVFMRKKEVQV